MYFNIAKYIYDKATVNITIKSEELKVFYLKSETRQQSLSHLFYLIQSIQAVLVRAIGQQKALKGIQIRKKEVKLPRENSEVEKILGSRAGIFTVWLPQKPGTTALEKLLIFLTDSEPYSGTGVRGKRNFSFSISFYGG